MKNSSNDTGKNGILGQNPPHCHMNCAGIELGSSLITDGQLPPDIAVE